MIKDEEILRQIRDISRRMKTPSDEMDEPVVHSPMNKIDESGWYQVYQITYEDSKPVGKKVLEDELTRQEARDTVRRYRNEMTTVDVIRYGYGFEKMNE